MHVLRAGQPRRLGYALDRFKASLDSLQGLVIARGAWAQARHGGSGLARIARARDGRERVRFTILP